MATAPPRVAGPRTASCERRRGLAGERIDCLGGAVVVEDRVEAAGSPAGEYALEGGYVHAEQVSDWLEVWGERDDEPRVEVPVGPSVEPMADPGANELSTGAMS